jgi:hypothetical protein
MASPVKTYQREMHDNLGYFATWLPNEPVHVGDVGVIERGRFRRVASLKELGIAFNTEVGSSTQDVQYASTQGTTIKTAGGAAVAELAKAAVTITFSESGAFVFSAAALTAQRIKDRVVMGEQVVQAYRDGKWKKEWLLVEAVQVADAATIVVSQDQSSEIVLAAKLDAPVPSIALSDPKLNLSVASIRGRLAHVVGERNLRPLYSCFRIHDSIFGPPALKAVRGAAPADNAIPLQRAELRDLLES